MEVLLAEPRASCRRRGAPRAPSRVLVRSARRTGASARATRRAMRTGVDPSGRGDAVPDVMTAVFMGMFLRGWVVGGRHAHRRARVSAGGSASGGSRRDGTARCAGDGRRSEQSQRDHGCEHFAPPLCREPWPRSGSCQFYGRGAWRVIGDGYRDHVSRLPRSGRVDPELWRPRSRRAGRICRSARAPQARAEPPRFATPRRASRARRRRGCRPCAPTPRAGRRSRRW